MNWQDFPTLNLFLEAAKELKVESQIVSKLGLVRFKKGDKSAFVYRTKTPLNNQVSVYLSESKYLAAKILQEENLPSQKYYLFTSHALAFKKACQLGFPLVVKPNVGSKGQGVTTNINSEKELAKAIKLAFKYHPKIVLSPYFPGEDYRLLVLKNKVIGAIKRNPPKIVGDGKKTIKELIAWENQKRQELNKKRFVLLMAIKIDQEVKRQIKKEGLDLESILAKGKILALRANANWSSGGTAQTMAIREFHPSIIKTSIQACQLLTLDFAGVDLIIKDSKRPLKDNGIVLEVNANPAIGVFHQPFTGQSQKVARKILEAFFFSNL